MDKPLQTFAVKIDATFEAHDIDDAFERLGKYFLALHELGIDAPSLFDAVDVVSIQPIRLLKLSGHT